MHFMQSSVKVSPQVPQLTCWLSLIWH